MKYELTFELPGLPPTTNSGGRAHWAAKVKVATRWKVAVLSAVRNRAPLAPLNKARLVLVRHSGSEPDFDGLVSSFKHVVDGLVDGRILHDDKPSVVGCPEYRWERAPRGKGKISVRVTSLEEVA